MADPLTIQRYPRGLLDLLGSKSSGQNPVVLSEVVQPIIDVGQLYQVDLAEARSATTAAANLTGAYGVTGTNLTVPAGEVWLLHNLSLAANTNLAAGESYQVRGAIYRSQWAQWQLSNASVSCGGVNTRPALGWQFHRPEILRPGDSVGIYVVDVQAASEQFTVSCYFTRLST